MKIQMKNAWASEYAGAIVYFTDEDGLIHEAMLTAVLDPDLNKPFAKRVGSPSVNLVYVVESREFGEDRRARLRLELRTPVRRAVDATIGRLLGRSLRPYGRQLVRWTSVPHKSEQTAHRIYWEELPS